MGLISRVSSRTYRNNPTITKIGQHGQSVWTSAAASAVVSTCSVQPLDVMKTTLQTTKLNKTQAFPNYNYLIIAKRIYHSSPSITGFYRGLNVALLRSVPGITFYLSGVEYLAPKIKSIQNSKNSLFKNESFSNILTAAIVRSTAVVIFMPLTVQKTRKEGGLKMDFSLKTLKLQYKMSLLPVIIRDAGYSGIYFGIYKYLTNDYSVAESAFTAAVMSSVITHPFDVAISQKQVFNKNVGLLSLFKNGEMFVGLMPRLMRRPISAVITWFTFEFLKN